jgi:hypothetical protein
MSKDTNTGYCNTGNRNTGDSNTGYCNTGYWNTGDRNTGESNTGYWNTGDGNTGYCNTITPTEVLIFNKLAKKADWDNATKPDWMYFYMTKWVSESNMTDKEKDAYPSYVNTGGYLKCWDSYQQCAKASWDNADKEDRDLTLKLPNFDNDIFKEIFGFSALENDDKKQKILAKIEELKKQAEAL